MFKHLNCLMTLISALALSACATDTLDSDRGAGTIIDVPCAEGPECPAGFECEVEEEHGVVTSYCKSHEDTDPGCPSGYELEIEHGQAFCKPHGGDDDDGNGGDEEGGHGNDDNGDDDGGAGDHDGGPGDDDGGPGGDHDGGNGGDDDGGNGGDDDGGNGGDDDPQGDECSVDSDCSGGLECEDGFCIPHGGDHD